MDDERAIVSLQEIRDSKRKLAGRDLDDDGNWVLRQAHGHLIRQNSWVGYQQLQRLHHLVQDYALLSGRHQGDRASEARIHSAPHEQFCESV